MTRARNFDARLSFSAFGKAWALDQMTPAYANVLVQGERLLVVPVDQGGGLRGGDVWRQKVHVGEGADVVWAPPAGVLVYPGRDEAVAVVDQSMTVLAGGRLDYLAKACVPCAGARLSQTLRVELSSTCDALIIDAWTLGRLASGESCQFLHLASQTEVCVDHKLIWKENWELDPATPKGLGVLAGNGMWMNVLSCGQAAHTRADVFAQRFYDLGGWGTTGELARDVRLTRLFCAEWIDPLDHWGNQ